MNRVEHYRAYRPRPFTKSERDDVTLLFGGLHWRAESLIQAALGRLGFKAEILPTATREDLLTGREVADIGQCCPTSFTTGNLANYLQGQASKLGAEAVNRDYVYVTAGSCGACRFGQYHQSYELALRSIGLDAFRMFLLAQDSVDPDVAEGGGLEMDGRLLTSLIWAVLLADVIQDLEYQVRPYEVVPGSTEKVVRESIALLREVYAEAPLRGGKWGAPVWFFVTSRFERALKRIRAMFDTIEVDRLTVKPIAKITGEFYLQTVEGAPNYGIHAWLEAEGAEVYPAAIAIWWDYLLRFAVQENEDKGRVDPRARLKAAALRGSQKVLHRTYDRFRKALGGVPHPLPDQYELRRLAAPYYHHRLSGGEGDMLIGKALWAHLNKKAHMTCELSPYACMPNTMSIGAMAAVQGQHPDLLYAPLEIKGDAEIHALSRCQMILTEARRRAVTEHQEVLDRTKLTPASARALLERHPEMRKATYKVPHHGVVGTAANLTLELASRR